MNFTNVFEQFLGQTNPPTNGSSSAPGESSSIGGNLPGIAGGVAAGGLLALLVSNKKVRKQIGKMAGGAVGLGASASLGALAYKAYSSWQASQPIPSDGDQQSLAKHAPPNLDEAAFDPAAQSTPNGAPFELALVKSMIAAANADGHIDKNEHNAIFDAIRKMPLDENEKALVIDTLMNPPSIDEIASFANGPAQASELYLASCLVIDVDHPKEVAYLEELAQKLSLPEDFVQHLKQQAATDNESLAA